MGIRVRRDEKAEKEEGSSVGGRDNGRKPFGRETVKGASFAKSSSSVGMVARRGKVGGAAREPIITKNSSARKVWLRRCFGDVKEGWCKGEKSGYMYCWPEPFRPTAKEG